MVINDMTKNEREIQRNQRQITKEELKKENIAKVNWSNGKVTNWKEFETNNIPKKKLNKIGKSNKSGVQQGKEIDRFRKNTRIIKVCFVKGRTLDMLFIDFQRAFGLNLKEQTDESTTAHGDRIEVSTTMSGDDIEDNNDKYENWSRINRQ